MFCLIYLLKRVDKFLLKNSKRQFDDCWLSELVCQKGCKVQSLLPLHNRCVCREWLGLDELSNPILQKKLWIEGGEEGISSFAEAVCSVFDDSGLFRAIESEDIPEPFLSSFLKLGDLVREVPDNKSPEETINHPEMQNIKEVSLELLQLINLCTRQFKNRALKNHSH